jgi:hypothetical protein
MARPTTDPASGSVCDGWNTPVNDLIALGLQAEVLRRLNAFKSPADRTVYVAGHSRGGSLVSCSLLLLLLTCVSLLLLLRRLLFLLLLCQLNAAIAAASSSGQGGAGFLKLLRASSSQLVPCQHNQTQQGSTCANNGKSHDIAHLCSACCYICWYAAAATANAGCVTATAAAAATCRHQCSLPS